MSEIDILMKNGIDVLIITPVVLQRVLNTSLMPFRNLGQIVIDNADCVLSEYADEIMHGMTLIQSKLEKYSICLFSSIWSETILHFANNFFSPLDKTLIIIPSAEQLVYSKIRTHVKYSDSQYLFQNALEVVNSTSLKKIAVAASSDFLLESFSEVNI